MDWINVKDRLPEDMAENQGRKVISCIVSVASCYPNGKPIIQKRQRHFYKGYYQDQPTWSWSRSGADRITHWKYPDAPPPKED